MKKARSLLQNFGRCNAKTADKFLRTCLPFKAVILLYGSSNLSAKQKRAFYIYEYASPNPGVWAAKNPDKIGVFAEHIFFMFLNMVEHRGFEPLTSTLPVWRAPNCANAPQYFVLYSTIFQYENQYLILFFIMNFSICLHPLLRSIQCAAYPHRNNAWLFCRRAAFRFSWQHAVTQYYYHVL